MGLAARMMSLSSFAGIHFSHVDTPGARRPGRAAFYS